MWTELAATVDALHAALMAVWIFGLPFLFWHRWPGLSKVYGIYAVAFVALTRLSHWLLGECFLTTMSRQLWNRASPSGEETDEWFTVRFAKLVFGLAPSHRAVAIGSEILVFLTAVGVLASLYKHGVARARTSRTPG